MEGWMKKLFFSSAISIWFMVIMVLVVMMSSQWMILWPPGADSVKLVSANVDVYKSPTPKERGVVVGGIKPRDDGGGGGGISTGEVPVVVSALLPPSPPPLGNYIQQTEFENPMMQQRETKNQSTSTIFNTISLPLNQSQFHKKYSTLEQLEGKLQLARVAIRDAKHGNELPDPDYVPRGPMYWNTKSFHRSYLEMENQFKIYVYEEGEAPIFHNGPCKSIYAIEGNFIHQMEINTQFRTRDQHKAHLSFLPISVVSIVHFIFQKYTNHHWHPMKTTVKDYVDLVAGRYSYWNRSLGADHFMLSCHDWGPELSKSVPELYKNTIRALCNANRSEGFNPIKDVSIPEILLPSGTTHGLIGGPSPSKRPILAFFAGGVHGPIRPILLQHWENKDNDEDDDVQIHKYLPKNVSYFGMMKKSRFCICPSGYEVASPRMVEAIYTGCVPVLIKEGYVAPFSDVLNWESFSVIITVKDIPNLKKILSGISTRRYIRMQQRGVQIRRHFEVNFPPKRYDVFHMILHSLWLRRLNLKIHAIEEEES